MMPGATEPELADDLRRIDPALEVLFISGYAHGEGDTCDPAMELLLHKPFSGVHLAATIRQLLDARA